MINRTKIRLGINVDHVATVRNARGGEHPDPVYAAQIAANAGADGITAHLREDRRHIRDDDVFRLKNEVALPLNFEMAATAEMQAIALNLKPNACCIVPEKRSELTTEGGLNVAGNMEYLKRFITPLKEAGIRISLFITADFGQIDAACEVKADIIELHTGKYSELDGAAKQRELERIIKAASYGQAKGLEIHAGHGLNYANAPAIAAIPEIIELNIGHFLIGDAMFVGLDTAIKKMIKVVTCE